MPAILSALFSALYAALATKDSYKNSLGDIFPAMNDLNSTMALEHNGTVALGVCFFFLFIMLILFLGIRFCFNEFRSSWAAAFMIYLIYYI